MARTRKRQERRFRSIEPVRTLDRYSHYRSGEEVSYPSNRRLPRTHDRRPPVLLSDDVDSNRTLTVFPTVVRQSSLPGLLDRSRVTRWAFTPIRTAKRVYRDLARPTPMYPETLKFCIRRAMRREVLFARKVAGRFGRSPGKRGKYRRTLESNYSC